MSRAKITKGIRVAGLDRRRRYEDLTEECFCIVKTDGRRYAGYWDKDEKKRYIYRYQWRWIQANGPIPKGCHLHHVNEDKSDDLLENLRLLKHGDHQRLHMTPDRIQHMREAQNALPRRIHMQEYVCHLCGKPFLAYRREGGTPRKYCSFQCSQWALNYMILPSKKITALFSKA